MFAECEKHYPSRSKQVSLATAVTNITKPVTKNNFGPSTVAGWTWMLANTCMTELQFSRGITALLHMNYDAYVYGGTTTVRGLKSLHFAVMSLSCI